MSNNNGCPKCSAALSSKGTWGTPICSKCGWDEDYDESLCRDVFEEWYTSDGKDSCDMSRYLDTYNDGYVHVAWVAFKEAWHSKRESGVEYAIEALKAIKEWADSYHHGDKEVEYHNHKTAIQHLGIIASNALSRIEVGGSDV